MHFTHYQKAGDKVFAVCPYQSPSVEAMKHDLLSSRNYFDFQQWARTQPPIYTDPSIKDGVYGKELFEEPVWQRCMAYDEDMQPYDHGWCDCTELEAKNDNQGGWPTRLYIRLKQPVKQEEKEVPSEIIDVLNECIRELYRFLPTTTFTLRKAESIVKKYNPITP